MASQVQDQPPVIIAPIHLAPKTPEQMAEGYTTVTMEFPNSVHLTVEVNSSVFYPKGIHEVPEHLADHWYLKAHGARRYYRPVAAPQPAPAAAPVRAQQSAQRPAQPHGGQRNPRPNSQRNR